MKLIFKKPLVFEGETYNEINMDGLKEMDLKTYLDTERFAETLGASRGSLSSSGLFAWLLAAKATDKPLELFKAMPPYAHLALTRMVLSQFFNLGTDDTKVEFGESYIGPDGRSFDSMDLSAVEDWTAEMMENCKRPAIALGASGANIEFETEFGLVVAERVTGIPVETMLSMKAGDGRRVAKAVQNAFFGGRDGAVDFVRMLTES